MSRPIKTYTSDAIDVTYEVSRCIHAAECVDRLAAVFDTEKRPWIQPENGSADAIAQTITHCPTGALQYQRKDGGTSEAPAEKNRVTPAVNGPLYVRGQVQIEMQDGTQVEEMRLALCRCGQSANKPYCDNAHRAAGFEASGDVGAVKGDAKTAADEPLHITPAVNGPLLLTGQFELVSADGQAIFAGSKAALCRCGGSANKPFCDGTHKRIGFSTEEDDNEG